ncbi:hypothetical protein OH76DRAFT_1407485 [Lentinus brumalis]|uniref:Uncharacterized protein n=1 Tax=Lentinus brumalis TaxID=2498619 RepID=A0A371D060_9APHY|nr:hypothetical protein OH76DRAFT_1407485 [Polyporus brumalis]
MELITDPDRLILFLSGLEGERTSAKGRHSLLDDDTSDKNAHRSDRTARVLDALARLLVHDTDAQPRQVFAVALVPPSLTRESAQVIISENSEVTEVAKNHARDILQGLYGARQLVDNQFPGGDSRPPKLLLPPFMPLDSEDAVQRKLANIETAIVRHSWSKMAKRFRKADRHLAFFEVSAAILAADQPERLSSLKAEHGWPSDAGFLKEFDRLRRGLQALHEELSKSVEGGQVQRVRAVLVLVDATSKALKASMPEVFDMCAAYHPAVSATPMPRIDFRHWIGKVLSTRADYLQLQRIIFSPALHSLLTERIEVTSTVQEPKPADALITADELRDALSGNVNVGDKVLGEYLRKRFKQKNGDRGMSSLSTRAGSWVIFAAR